MSRKMKYFLIYDVAGERESEKGIQQIFNSARDLWNLLIEPANSTGLFESVEVTFIFTRPKVTIRDK